MIDFETYTKISNEMQNFINSITNENIIGNDMFKKAIKHVAQNDINDVTRIFPDIEHTIHFLENIDETERRKQLKGNFEQISNNAKKWNDILQKRGSRLSNKQESGLKTLMQFKDGFKMVQLNSAEHCSREGSLMGHCVGGYNPTRTTILSLRDPQNKPHVTVEIRGNSVQQIKGKGNKPPIAKYQRYIRYFLDKNPQYDITSDGENIGYVKFNGVFYNPDSVEWNKVYNTKVIPMQQRSLNEIKQRIMNG